MKKQLLSLGLVGLLSLSGCASFKACVAGQMADYATTCYALGGGQEK